MRPRLVSLSLALSLLAPTLAGQNEKVFFSDNQASGTDRIRNDTPNVYYFVPPLAFRYGYGKASGVHVTLKDSNQATSEEVFVGFGRVTNGVPDAAGNIGIAKFTLFGSGSGAATTTFRLTLTTPVDLPERYSTYTILPAAKAATDVVSIRYQDGASVKLPSGVTPVQMTYHLAGTKVETHLKPGSVVDLGGIYDEPVLGFFNKSTAYGASDDLYGPESLHFDSSRGDALGYYLRSADFKSQVAVIGISASRASPPVPTPFGPVLILGDATFQVLPLPVVLDATGSAKTLTVPIPKGLKIAFWAQGVFLSIIKPGVLRTSDATGVQTQ